MLTHTHTHTPSPELRFPGWCGPLPYSASIIYNLTINPVMVYSGFYLGGSRVVADTQHAWMGLAIGSGVAVLGMAMMGCAMNATHRHTFYKPRPLCTLLDTLWEERELTYMSDETMAVGVDPSRADLIGHTSDYWVSIDKLRAWLANWDVWEADQPAWFTMKGLDFQNQVVQYAPVEALPRTALFKILTNAEDSEGNRLRMAPETATDVLVAKVQAYRKGTSARERAGRFAKAVLAIRLYMVAILISYVDLAGDVLVTLTLLQSETSKQSGYVTMGLTGFAQVVQAIISLAMGQGGVAAFAALIGAKPLLDTYNVLSDRPLTRGAKADHEIAFTLTRAEEVALQSLPQGFYQCLVLLQIAQAGETSSWVQWASVGGAALSVAFIVADTDRGLDTSATFRMDHPLVHGYTPGDKRRAWMVSLGTFAFIGGTVVSKWVAIATLATASGSVAAGWLATECVLLLVLRQVVEGSWRFHMRGLDAAVPSALMHLMLYIVSIAAPFPLLRFPGYLGPSLYCASVCYQTIASPLMLLVAFSMEGGSGLPQAELWALLGVATVVLLVGATLMGCYMVPEYRKTFYQVMWGTLAKGLKIHRLESQPPWHLMYHTSKLPSTSLSRRSSSGCGTIARAIRTETGPTHLGLTCLHTPHGPGPRMTKSELGSRAGSVGRERSPPGNERNQPFNPSPVHLLQSWPSSNPPRARRQLPLNNSLPRSQVHREMEGAATPPVDAARGAPARPQTQVRHCKREQAALPPRVLLFDSLAVARGVRRRRRRTEHGGKCEGGAEVKAAAFEKNEKYIYCQVPVAPTFAFFSPEVGGQNWVRGDAGGISPRVS